MAPSQGTEKARAGAGTRAHPYPKGPPLSVASFRRGGGSRSFAAAPGPASRRVGGVGGGRSGSVLLTSRRGESEEPTKRSTTVSRLTLRVIGSDVSSSTSSDRARAATQGCANLVQLGRRVGADPGVGNTP